jgi:diguanylate cyclase (GGDEF)-like protein/PAS domain S-box-containing protein
MATVGDPRDPAMVRPTWRTTLPFGICALLGLLSTLAPPYQHSIPQLAAAALLFAGLLRIYEVALGRSTATWLDPVAAWLMFPFIMLLRDGLGGGSSAVGALVAIPVFWLALYGSRRDLLVGIVLTAATFVVPILLEGSPAYPTGEWRKAVLWTGIAFFLGPVVQEVVRRLERETRRERELSAQVNGIMRGATMTALISTDLEGTVTLFGVGAEGMLGRRAEDVLGTSVMAVLDDPGELAEVAAELGVPAGFAVYAELARRQEPSRTWTYLRPDGEEVCARLAMTEMRDAADVPTGYLAVAIDVTSAVRTRRDLSEAEERWRVLMDHLPDTTVVLVEQGKGIKLVTGAGVLGHRLRDSAGRWLQEIATQEGVPISAMLEAAFAGREEPPVDASVDGGDHEILVSPLPASSDRPQALMMIRDVSRDRERQRTTTGAKERAERLFVDAPQGIALLSPAGTVVQVNPALCELFGRSDLVGQPLASSSYGVDDGTVAVHLRHLDRVPERRAESQWSARGAHGEEIHVVLTSTVLAGEDGDADLVLTNVVDVSERYRYEQQMAHLADHDPLTGLANRRRFDAELQHHVDDTLRYGVQGAVLMLDLDRFKEVNDTLGHTAGDDLLVRLAVVLKDRLRSTDIVARLGGDEFAVLLPHADRKSAESVAHTLVERIRAEVNQLDDTRSNVTASIGVVMIDGSQATASELLTAADSAMYLAKQSGRDQYALVP